MIRRPQNRQRNFLIAIMTVTLLSIFALGVPEAENGCGAADPKAENAAPNAAANAAPANVDTSAKTPTLTPGCPKGQAPNSGGRCEYTVSADVTSYIGYFEIEKECSTALTLPAICYTFYDGKIKYNLATGGLPVFDAFCAGAVAGIGTPNDNARGHTGATAVYSCDPNPCGGYTTPRLESVTVNPHPKNMGWEPPPAFAGTYNGFYDAGKPQTESSELMVRWYGHPADIANDTTARIATTPSRGDGTIWATLKVPLVCNNGVLQRSCTSLDGSNFPTHYARVTITTPTESNGTCACQCYSENTLTGVALAPSNSAEMCRQLENGSCAAPSMTSPQLGKATTCTFSPAASGFKDTWDTTNFQGKVCELMNTSKTADGDGFVVGKSPLKQDNTCPAAKVGTGANAVGCRDLLTVVSFSPASGPPGTLVTVTGTNLGGIDQKPWVYLNGAVVGRLNGVAPNATSLTFVVPPNGTTGRISVTTESGGSGITKDSFIVTSKPDFTGFTPSSGPVGTFVTLEGNGFTNKDLYVTFSPNVPAKFTVVSPTKVIAVVPQGAATGPIEVRWGAPGTAASVPIVSVPAFTVTVPPATSTVTSVLPSAGPPGFGVTISGSGFGGVQGTSTVTFNGSPATVTSWSDTTITVQVPSVPAGNSNVVVMTGGPSNATVFEVKPGGTVIQALTPPSGPVGTTVTITGTGFGSGGKVQIGNMIVTATYWSATSITFTIPDGATTGNVTVLPSTGGPSNSLSFTTTTLPACTATDTTPKACLCGGAGAQTTCAVNQVCSAGVCVATTTPTPDAAPTPTPTPTTTDTTAATARE